MVKNNTNNLKLLELRSLCFSEGEEFLQMSYLCGVDSSADVGEILTEKLGSLRNISAASMGKFMNLGIFPASIVYERGGEVLRSMENPLDGFQKVYGNIYRPTNDGVSIAHRLSKRAA